MRLLILSTTLCITWRFETDGAEAERLGHGLFHLMLLKILQQPQHLDKLAPAGVAHARFQQPAQAVEALVKLPAIQRGGLVQRPNFVF